MARPIEIPRAEFSAQLRQTAEMLALQLETNQVDALLDYLALLLKWNGVYNLTAVRDPQQMLVQHLIDSMAAISAFADARQVLDVGAGGGLPGIVLAIWAQVQRPQMQITLIDTVHKKTAFLTQVKAELGLHQVSVITGRVEECRHIGPFDIITSRAFAELKDFVQWSRELLKEGGHFVALKGVVPTDEIKALPAEWRVREIRALRVPTLDAQRHLILIERQTQASAPAAAPAADKY